MDEAARLRAEVAALADAGPEDAEARRAAVEAAVDSARTAAEEAARLARSTADKLTRIAKLATEE